MRHFERHQEEFIRSTYLAISFAHAHLQVGERASMDRHVRRSYINSGGKPANMLYAERMTGEARAAMCSPRRSCCRPRLRAKRVSAELLSVSSTSRMSRHATPMLPLTPCGFCGFGSVHTAATGETVLTSSIMLSFRLPVTHGGSVRQESSVKCPN